MINDFSTLQAAVTGWLARADLAARIPDFIQLAEARISDEIRVRQMDATQTGVLANYLATLPADFVEPRSLIIQFGGIEFSLEPQATTESYNKTFGSVPRNYRVGATSIQTFGGQGTEAYTLHYYAAIPSLSDANPQNWLILARPQIYLYATLLEAAPYLHDDARTAIWGQGYANACAALEGTDKRAKYKNVRMRPASAVNP